MKLSTAIRKCREETLKSNMKHRVGAILYDSKRFVTGYNRKFDIEIPNREKSFSIHAEEMAILRGIKQKIDFHNSMMVVVRINRGGKNRRSLPCEYCQKLIKEVKVPEVYYVE